MLRGAAVITVDPDAAVVESQLAARELSCPSCRGGALAPWGWARERAVGRRETTRRVRPRRARCPGCAATHVLLPARLLLRRADWVETIGQALEQRAGGGSQRAIVRALGVPRSTLRGWLDRVAERGEAIGAHFLRWTLWLDPRRSRLEPQGTVLGDAVMAIAQAAQAARSAARWRFAAAASGGRLLCNTGPPFPAPWAG